MSLRDAAEKQNLLSTPHHRHFAAAHTRGPEMQGLGVEADQERALKLYQAAARAEGQLGGELAADVDEAMAKLVEAKQKGVFSEKGQEREREEQGR